MCTYIIAPWNFPFILCTLIIFEHYMLVCVNSIPQSIIKNLPIKRNLQCVMLLCFKMATSAVGTRICNFWKCSFKWWTWSNEMMAIDYHWPAVVGLSQKFIVQQYNSILVHFCFEIRLVCLKLQHGWSCLYLIQWPIPTCANVHTQYCIYLLVPGAANVIPCIIIIYIL